MPNQKRPGTETGNEEAKLSLVRFDLRNQFRKGRTGNPRGRVRGEENLISVFKRHVLKRVKMKDGEEIRSISLAEAVILKNLSAALRKNSLAMGNIYRLAEDSGEFIDMTDRKQAGGQIAVPVRPKNIEEFFAELGRKVGE